MIQSGAKIAQLTAYTIIDSRGKPTVEAALFLDNGVKLTAAVPSGASTGIHEALELRDHVANDFLGQGVGKAVSNIIDMIAPRLLASSVDLCDQAAVDDFLIKLDGTENKSNLGANAILAVSMIMCRYAAYCHGVELYQHLASLYGNTSPKLPVPYFNVINGGAHAGNVLPFQEFMIVPHQAGSFSEALKMGCETYQCLKALIKKKHGVDATNVGDEGGFAPNIGDPTECMELLLQAIKDAGHEGKIAIALDVAASEFQVEGKPGFYNLDIKNPAAKEEPRILSSEQLASLYVDLCIKYPVVSLEDPFDQDDWAGWQALMARIPPGVQVVGDDLTVTNPKRIQRAIQSNACSALLLKINQIGSITESLRAARMATDAGWNVMVSHRSGETEDTFIADLATALGCGQLKSGAPCRSERLAKYNRLVRLEHFYKVRL